MRPDQLIRQANQYGQFLPTPVTAILSLWIPAGVGSRERIYFEQPGWWSEDFRVVRMQLLARQNPQQIDPLSVLDTTVTMVDVHDRMIMESVPLRRLSMMPFSGFGGTLYRCLPLYEPFQWDPIRSYIQSWKGYASPLEVPFLIDYVRP